MLYLVRENLYIGNINAAAKVLLGRNKEITHILSVVSSASIDYFSEWNTSFSVPTKEIRAVYKGGSGEGGELDGDKIHYVLENAGHDLKVVRMAVPLNDNEFVNLLDSLEVCLDFIDESRKNGSVLVHCHEGVSRSASIITAYLMRTERISLQDALESLRKSKIDVCPNDGFLGQLTMFEEMGFKVDHSSPIYKRFSVMGLGVFSTMRADDLMDAASSIELMHAHHSTLQSHVSSNAFLSLNDVIKDLSDLHWQECCITSIETINSVTDFGSGVGEESSLKPAKRLKPDCKSACSTKKIKHEVISSSVVLGVLAHNTCSTKKIKHKVHTAQKNDPQAQPTAQQKDSDKGPPLKVYSRRKNLDPAAKVGELNSIFENWLKNIG